MTIAWKGIYPAVTTPFHPDESLDLDTFSRQLDQQILAGVDGIIIGGSLGEASTLSFSERRELLQTGLATSAGRVPVLMNIAERRTTEAIRQAQTLEQDGADGFMLLPPLNYGASPDETVAYFRAVAQATHLPIVIYNNPVDYKIGVSTDMFAQLIDLSNIQAVKESTRDLTNVTRLRNAFGERIKILGGVDTLALECLVAGGDGWIAGLVNAFPRETVVLYRLVKAGRLDEALQLYRWFMPLLELDIHPKLVQYIKLAAVATGLGTEHTRAPRLALSGAERQGIQGIIDRALAQRPDLKAYENL
ncbi:MAG: dihydrodipicolinate synthase family protein [Bacteroidota bacterium]